LRWPGTAPRCGARAGSSGRAGLTNSTVAPDRENLVARRRPRRSRSGPPPKRRSPVGGWSIAATLAVIAIILYAVRVALLPFVFAAAIAFVTDPLVRAIQRRLGRPRWVAATLLYLLFLALLGAAGCWLGAGLVHDIKTLAADGPGHIRALLTAVAGKRGLMLFGTAYSVDELMHLLGTGVRRLVGSGWLQSAGTLTLGTVLGAAFSIVLTPYFMISGPRLAAGSIWLIPPERRASVAAVLPKIIPVLRRYLIGVALVVTYAISVAWIGFGPIFRLSHAGLLAFVVGSLELIPVVGPLVAAGLVGIVATQQPSLEAAALLVGFAVLLRLSIDNLVGPLVLGAAARLHPVVVMAAFIGSGILFGIVGLLLAVPVAVCVKVTLEQYYAEPVGAPANEKAS
jgi:predicted PurR-regulated permease PerM